MMNKEELEQWMADNAIEYTNTKELPNGTLFNLTECPFCDGAHKDGAYIIWCDSHIVAKCHHSSCSDANFAKLYKLKTGKELPSKSKKTTSGNSSNDESMASMINSLVNDGKLEVFLDDYNNVMAKIISMDDKHMLAMNVDSYEFKMHLGRLLYDYFGIVPDRFSNDVVSDYLGILAYKSQKKCKVYKRICNLGDKIIYELNKDTNTCVVITKDKIIVGDKVDVVFHHSQYYANQVMPVFDESFNGDWRQLTSLVRKHFNFSNNDDSIMFTLYLVSCFLGDGINHPILNLSGQKGSGKSTAIRRFCRLVDPKSIELGNIPKKEEDVALKISQSYVNDFDNLSYLKNNISDLFCKCATGGNSVRRTLYKNLQQTVFDLRSVVVMDGIDIVIKQSDLFDRTIFIQLERFKSDELKTEKELDEEFDKDLPIMLGMCFCILQLVMDDNEPIDRTESWRMADFYEYAIRIGRVMGYKESYIKKVLKKNRDFMNHQALLEEPVAVILLNYMEYSSEKNHTVSELLKIIKRLASELQIDLALLPKDPAALSRKINKLKSNLEDEGITYEIKNKGYAKVITIRNAKPRHEPINFS